MITETSTTWVALTSDIHTGIILLLILVIISFLDFIRRFTQFTR